MADTKAPDKGTTIDANKSVINTLFLSFRDSIDFHHDRRERIIKSSRDITTLSKKLIYTAHRVTQKPLKSILDEAQTKKSEILELFRRVSVELEGANFHRYNKSISPSIQEYIEAISFLEYLENGVLIIKERIDDQFKDADGNQFLQITYDDYLLGIADLTGELMRYAINCVGVGNHDQALRVCQFLREIKSGYDILRIPKRSQLWSKVETMKKSLIKVEDACYATTIRGSEYPKNFYQHIVSEHAKKFETMEVDE